jgi:hypothetical protein
LASALAGASGTGVNAPREEQLDLWPLLTLLALLVIAAEWLVLLWPARRGVRVPARGGAT